MNYFNMSLLNLKNIKELEELEFELELELELYDEVNDETNEFEFLLLDEAKEFNENLELLDKESAVLMRLFNNLLLELSAEDEDKSEPDNCELSFLFLDDESDLTLLTFSEVDEFSLFL